MSSGNIVVVVIIVVIVAVAVGWLWYKGNKPVPPPPAGVESFNADYARLGNMYGQPLFEPGLLGRCAAGSFMYSDNPTLGAFCATVPPNVLDRVACNRAYIGRPLHLAYTSPSNACGSCAPSFAVPPPAPTIVQCPPSSNCTGVMQQFVPGASSSMMMMMPAAERCGAMAPSQSMMRPMFSSACAQPCGMSTCDQPCMRLS